MWATVTLALAVGRMALNPTTSYTDVPNHVLTEGLRVFRDALMRAYARSKGAEAAALFRQMYEIGPDKRWVETAEGALNAERRFLKMMKGDENGIGKDAAYILNYAMA